jgi:beta-lactamase class D OXA-50
MRGLLVGLSLLLVSWQQLVARGYQEVPELATFFQRYELEGTFVLLDASNDEAFVSNRARAEERFIPASTFKIANSLIGLDAGAVKNVDEVLPYGGKPQPFKAWEKDMGLRDAIKVSNVAVYQELARRIGIERMREGVRKLGYGNMEIGHVVDQFWLRGPLKISAVEQAEFLKRLTSGKVPVKADAIRAVREITLLEKTESYELHGKTGWLFQQRLGWWVGWIERDAKVYPFALNIDLKSDADAEKRVPLGRECLKALGKL